LAAIIERIPSKRKCRRAFTSFNFDSHYNPFRGIEVIFRVINGEIKRVRKFMATGNEYYADEIGTLKLNQVPKKVISTGDVGYLISGIKEAKKKVGDTVTDAKTPTTNMVKGFEDVKPMVLLEYIPVDTEDYEDLRNSMEKLQLNDASLVFYQKVPLL
jgi:GTP-binding protein LepA